MQTVDSANTQEVRWEHQDPSNATYAQTGYNGLMYFDTQAELDPLGSNVGTNNPYNTGNQPDNMSSGGWGHGTWGDPFGSYSCMVDWIPQPCSFAMQVLSSGAGVIGPLDQFQSVRYNGQDTWATFRAYADGYAGYMPHNARYIGNGFIRPMGPVGPPRLGTGGGPRDTDLQRLNNVTGNRENHLGYVGNNWLNLPLIESRLIPSELDQLENNLIKLMADDDCANFINAVINALPNFWSFGAEKAEKYGGSITDNFNRVKNAGGFWDKTIQPGARALFGPGKNHGGKITFRTGDFRFFSNRPIAYKFNQGGSLSMVSYSALDTAGSNATEALETTLVLVHELIHGYWSPINAPIGMTHNEMDGAAKKAVENLGIISGIPYKKDGNASYFNAILKEVCGGIKL